MITVDLFTLNKSYQSLLAVSRLVNKGQLKYRLGRLVADAKKEMELLGQQVQDIAIEHGAKTLSGQQFEFDPETQMPAIIKYEGAMKTFCRSNHAELWGKPEFFTEAEFEPFDLSADHVSDLLWLIGESAEDVGKKTKAASA